MAKSEQVFTNCTTGGPVQVYVRDGKISRVEPLVFGEEDAAGKWTMMPGVKSFFHLT
jgi:hypothetical protein